MRIRDDGQSAKSPVVVVSNVRGRRRPLAPLGVIETPRVDLKNALCRALDTDLRADRRRGIANPPPKSFIQGGRPEAGVKLNSRP
jgi:hypothetical protein